VGKWQNTEITTMQIKLCIITKTNLRKRCIEVQQYEEHIDGTVLKTRLVHTPHYESSVEEVCFDLGVRT
jgi:hypothetical protein